MPSGGVLDESASVDNAQLTIDEIQAVVAAAHDYGFTVAAHAHGAEAIRRAVIGGVDSIEHGTFMDDADMKLMKEHGTWYVPTIIAGKYVEEKANVRATTRRRSPRRRSRSARSSRRPPARRTRPASRSRSAPMPRSIRTARTRRSSSTWSRPACRRRSCCRPRRRTRRELLKKSKDLGTVEPGKFADVVAVEGNPLDDITADAEGRFRDEGRRRLQAGRKAGRHRSHRPSSRRRSHRARNSWAIEVWRLAGAIARRRATCDSGAAGTISVRDSEPAICQTRQYPRPSSTPLRPISRPRSSTPRSSSRCSSISGRPGAGHARRLARCSKKSSANMPAR